jgi:hypothetical protein
MHARYYHAALGRWTQADTIVPNSANPQDWNRYTYASNNPVLHVDPGGHDDEPWWVSALQATANFCYSFGDHQRNPGPAQFHDNFWAGVGALSMYLDVVGYTARAVAGGRWENAGRGIRGVGQMHWEYAKHPEANAGIVLNAGLAGAPVRAVTQSGPAFVESAGEVFQGKRGAADVLWHGTMFAGDVGTTLGMYSLVSSAGTSTAARLQQAATEADGVVPGEGRVAGTLKHSAAEEIVNSWGNPNLHTEQVYLNGAPVVNNRNVAGSVRLDVVEGDIWSPTAIYDFKFGSAKLTPARIQQIVNHLPKSNVPVTQIKPR